MVVELVDTQDLKSCTSNSVRVRFPPAAQRIEPEGRFGNRKVSTCLPAGRLLLGKVHPAVQRGERSEASELPARGTKKYMNTENRFTNIILVVIIVATISVGGYFVFIKKSKPAAQQPTPISNSTQTKTSVSPTPTSKNETANWTVYSNTKYNYSFRYPTNFTIYTATDQNKAEIILPTATSERVALTDKKEMLFCCEPLTTSFSVINGSIDTKNWRQYGDIPDYRIKSQGEITFADRKAFEVRGSLFSNSKNIEIY